MNCREFEDKVAAYIEGAISGEPLREMAAHRAACPKCANLAKLHEAMFAALDNTPPVRAPRGLADSILAAAESGESESAGNVVPFPKRQVHAISCETFESRVVAFVDGSLKGNAAREMTEHRKSCAACARVAAIHETVAASLGTVEPMRAPAGLAERIFAAAAAEETAEEVLAAANVRTRLLERFGAVFTGAGALVAAMVLLAGANWSRLGVGSLVDSFHGAILAFFPMLEAWFVSVLPAQWIARLQALASPVSLPYVSVSLPAYSFAPLLLFAALMAYYIHQTSSDAAAVEYF